MTGDGGFIAGADLKARLAALEAENVRLRADIEAHLAKLHRYGCTDVGRPSPRKVAPR